MPRIQPDQLALEIAHRRLRIGLSFSDAMRNPTYKKLIESRARVHIKQREKFDLKKCKLTIATNPSAR